MTKRRNFMCTAPGCERPARAKQLCSFHYQRLRDTGSVHHARNDGPCVIYADGVAYLPLTQGRRSVIDAADGPLFEGVRAFYSGGHSTGYAKVSVRTADGGPKPVLLHRFLLKPPAHLYVDHINHDGLDNRRSNLRLATPAQNQRNMRKKVNSTSRFKGVSRHVDGVGWTACIGNPTKYLGYFRTDAEAAQAYDLAAVESYGEFALTNADLGLL